MAILITGCATTAAPARRGNVAECFAFAVRAVREHVVVTGLPPACAGLSAGQVSEAADRAIREAVGPIHRAEARSRAVADGRYLAALVSAARSSHRQAVRPSAPPAPPARLPARLAALTAWICTATAGAFLLARRRAETDRWTRIVMISHGALGGAGLAVWITFLASSALPLAWLAVGITFVLAGLGMATLLSMPSGPPPPAQPPLPRPGRRPPVLVIALHGVLATTTILLVLLATIASG